MWATRCKEYEVSTFYASIISYQTKQTQGVPKLIVKSTFVWFIGEMASTNQTHPISILDNINILKIDIDIKEYVLVFV